MITLYLGLSEDEDVDIIRFENEKEFINHLKDIKSYNFKCVWLITNSSEDNDNIFVSEYLMDIILLILDQYLYGYDEDNIIHLYGRTTYREAYMLAADMREANPLH